MELGMNGNQVYALGYTSREWKDIAAIYEYENSGKKLDTLVDLLNWWESRLPRTPKGMLKVGQKLLQANKQGIDGYWAVDMFYQIFLTKY